MMPIPVINSRPPERSQRTILRTAADASKWSKDLQKGDAQHGIHGKAKSLLDIVLGVTHIAMCDGHRKAMIVDGLLGQTHNGGAFQYNHLGFGGAGNGQGKTRSAATGIDDTVAAVEPTSANQLVSKRLSAAEQFLLEVSPLVLVGMTGQVGTLCLSRTDRRRQSGAGAHESMGQSMILSDESAAVGTQQGRHLFPCVIHRLAGSVRVARRRFVIQRDVEQIHRRQSPQQL